MDKRCWFAILVFFQSILVFAQYASRADSLFQIADSLVKTGQYKEAAKFFEQSAAVEKKCKNPRTEDLSFELYNAGMCYSAVGEFQKALRNYLEAQGILKSIGNREQEANLLLSISDVYEMMNEPGKAAEVLDQAYTIWNELNKPEGKAKTLKKSGQVNCLLKKYDKAFDYYGKALFLYRALKNTRGEAEVLYCKGDAFRALSLNDSAKVYYAGALELFTLTDDKTEISACRNSMGETDEAQGNYEKAMSHYSEALSGFQASGDGKGIATSLNNIGNILNTTGQYQDAISYYEKALEIYKQMEYPPGIASVWNNLGSIYFSLGQHQEAMGYYRQSLTVYSESGNKEGIATTFNNTGMIYNSLGQYDSAIANYRSALKIYKETGNLTSKAMALNNIGGVYNNWGQYEYAVVFYTQAMEIFQQIKNKPEVARMYNNIGGIYETTGQFEKAISHYNLSMQIYSETGDKNKRATVLNNIGKINSNQGKYNEALTYYNQAYDIYNQSGEKSNQAVTLNNTGSIYLAKKDYANSISTFNEALTIRRQLGEKKAIAGSLYNLGVACFYQKQYTKAIEYLSESVTILEELRKTATGDIRRDYLSSQIHSYYSLIQSYVQVKDYGKAFYYNELSRSKLLAERLVKTDKQIIIPSLQEVSAKIPENTSFIVFSTIDSPYLIYFIIKKGNTTVHTLDKEDVFRVFLKNLDIRSKVISGLSKSQLAQLQLYIDKGDASAMDMYCKKNIFNIIIQSYCEQLSKTGNEGKTKNLSEEFYKSLIAPVYSYIESTPHLFIMPDGILGHFPFETLLNENGEYLIEKHSVSYIHSLSVQRLIENRQYPDSRQSLLAFGISKYVRSGATQAHEELSLNTLEYLRRKADLSIHSQSSLKEVYTRLGYTHFDDIPGSGTEVRSIAEIIPETEVVLDNKATEQQIKIWSESGKLTGYKAIHFSTHGITVPELPELSALVLYQTGDDSEDGFLQTEEIMNLKIKADFVNLSACETGLGKVYSGEGVVGIAQSFLIAGANGLSVSLWQVDDESTAAFMKELYRLTREKNSSYAEAICEVKRKFITGEINPLWKSPFHWAPFVYYGKK